MVRRAVRIARCRAGSAQPHGRLLATADGERRAHNVATVTESSPSTGQPVLAAGGIRLVLGLLTFFGFLGALDQNVIVTTLAKMLGDTNVPIVLFAVGKSPSIEFDRAGWLVTGYLLGYVAVLPLMGAVSDVYGRRRTLQLALAVFALGSVIAALADTLPLLVLARTGQALGAGALLPVSLAAAADLVGLRQQGRALGLIAAAAELGGVCGPLYGGFISQLSELGWRLIFWLNVPIVLLLLPLTLLLPATGSPRSVDYRGSVILGLALAGLVAGPSSSGIFGSSMSGWSRPAPSTCWLEWRWA
jgi:MFS family permease